ncbi:MAG TPA: amidohydrolase family protein [Chloroflexota bacterium]|nr:amidohydrolase family protein [Chloroflexota bacterium]
MIVDIHAHYHPARFNEALQALGYPARFGGPVTDSAQHLSERLEMMDAANVGLQILSPAAGHAPYGADERLSVEAARLANDLTAELVSRHPTKFKALISLPLPHIDASLRELRRGYDELGFIGVNIHCSALNRSTAEEEFEPIYEEINRRNGLIFYHPAGNAACSPLIADYGLGGAMGTSVEDAVIAAHLVGRRMPSKYPNITYVIPHLGGPIAMLLERMNNQFSMRQHELPEPPSVTLKRFYYDTVGHASHAALLCAWKAYGAEHIVPGSDFPVLVAFETYARTFEWIREVEEIPTTDREQILEKSAPAILNL